MRVVAPLRSRKTFIKRHTSELAPPDELRVPVPRTACFGSPLVQRNRDVHDLIRAPEVVFELGLAGEEIDRIEAQRPVDRQDRERLVAHGDPAAKAAVDVEPGRFARIDGEFAGRAERAVVRGRLRSDLVERGIKVEQRGRRAEIQVVVRVGRADDPQGGRRWNVGQRPIDERGAARVDIVPEVLAGVADDAEPIGRGVEVHAERGAVERHRQGAHQRARRGHRIECIDASGVADPVEQPVLHPVVDADQAGVARQARDGADRAGALR